MSYFKTFTFRALWNRNNEIDHNLIRTYYVHVVFANRFVSERIYC
jgi:hypothetical protein